MLKREAVSIASLRRSEVKDFQPDIQLGFDTEYALHDYKP